MTQSRKYDPNGDFIRYWLPELKNISVNYIHRPELMSIEAQVKNDVIIGKQYPTSIINISHWAS
jgi:deoxyribodipyrimidine photo-lyase